MWIEAGRDGGGVLFGGQEVEEGIQRDLWVPVLASRAAVRVSSCVWIEVPAGA